MAFSLVRSELVRTSRELFGKGAAGPCGVLNRFLAVEMRVTSVLRVSPSLLSNNLRINSVLINTARQHSRISMPSYAFDLETDSDSDSDSDNEKGHRHQEKQTKKSQRGDSEFWRRKMRTLHKILDVNRDGVISFDDYSLLAKRFTDVGNLSPEISAEFLEVMKQTWEEQWGEINPYNLVTAEQFLTEIHHKLNDKDLNKKIGRFLPYLFKAVDIDHTGHLNLDQYKLFFRCLGLTDEAAAVSFAVIDRNGDGQLSLDEFVHLGRQYFLSENEKKISKMFWGPLVKN